MIYTQAMDKSALDRSSISVIDYYKNLIGSEVIRLNELRKLLISLQSTALDISKQLQDQREIMYSQISTMPTNSQGQKDLLEEAKRLLDLCEEDLQNILDDIQNKLNCLSGCYGSCQKDDFSEEQPTCNDAVCNDTVCNEAGCNDSGICTNDDYLCIEGNTVACINNDTTCVIGVRPYCISCNEGVQTCDTTCYSDDIVTPECNPCNTGQGHCVKCNEGTNNTECDATIDSQVGCIHENESGDCQAENEVGDCVEDNSAGNCEAKNRHGDCIESNISGECKFDDYACAFENESGRCVGANTFGDCNNNNINGEIGRAHV